MLLSFPKKTLALVALLTFGLSRPSWAASGDGMLQSLPDSLGDSSVNADDIARRLYESAALGFEAAYRRAQALGDAVLLAEVESLVREAAQSARAEDYETGLVMLETARDLVEQVLSMGDAQADTDPEFTSVADMNVEAVWRTTVEMLTGVDLWRQEFELNLLEGDSTILEGSGNPYYGARLNWEYRGNPALKAHTGLDARISRDYYSGEHRLALGMSPQHWLSVEVDNQIEGISYRDAEGLRYVQDEFDATVIGKLLPGLRLALKNELRLREYQTESEFYPTYLQYRGQAYLTYLTPNLSRIGLQYTHKHRGYPNYPQRNYLERRWYAFAHLATFGSMSALADYSYRDRVYDVVTDSSLINSYQDHFLTTNLKVKLLPRLALRFDGAADLRLYAGDAALTPDYFDVEIRPALVTELGWGWSLTSGYLYYSRDYNHLAPTEETDLEEDYYANGAVVGLDFLSSSGMILSVMDTFQMRRYPRRKLTALNDFNFYTDRNINSILLFVSWKISPHWALNGFLNLDDDRRDQRDDNDSRNTLFSIELNYIFR